jgi:hypothetical protein
MRVKNRQGMGRDRPLRSLALLIQLCPSLCPEVTEEIKVCSRLCHGGDVITSAAYLALRSAEVS